MSKKLIALLLLLNSYVFSTISLGDPRNDAFEIFALFIQDMNSREFYELETKRDDLKTQITHYQKAQNYLPLIFSDECQDMAQSYIDTQITELQSKINTVQDRIDYMLKNTPVRLF